ncbi:MAG: DUF6173 family protein [Paracoccaceae bacterium]|uniref:DUF6173 family protein n=1 Tax=Seohaeicola saemankumensis TaxID=481181 RepID=UPI001E4F5D39|nr:DUF6173 family protein [Seohaeicola saemankumensis]MCD1626201.1 hypothetical protein [Seohaeicola saemankumensis]
METKISTVAEAHERDPVLPRRCDVQTEDGPDVTAQALVPLDDIDIEDKSPAEWAYDRLVIYIQEFEAQLDNQHEVAMGFAGSDAGVLQIEGMGFFDPDILTFHGMDEDGVPTQLIQHVSQLSVILRAMPKSGTQEAPKRIGFRLARRPDTA